MRRLALLCFLAVAACSPPARKEHLPVIERVLRDCGVSVRVGMTEAEMTAVSAHLHTYETPSPWGFETHTGDGVFPMTENPQKVTKAVVLICASYKEGWLSSRSPRFAFFIDKDGRVVGIEERSLMSF